MTYDHTDADVPMMQPHHRERWLWRNPVALASVLRGIEQAARGEGRYLGSFSATGAIGYDKNGDHYTVTYPPRGMPCS